MTQRYVVMETGDGEAILWDQLKEQAVLTSTGAVYEAPVTNVQWTADTMNARTNNDTQTPAEMVSEPEPEIMADWEREIEATGTVSGILTGPAPAPRHAAPDRDLAGHWAWGAYRNATSSAERAIRQARDLVHNGELSVPRLTALLDSAMRALESGIDTAEEHNPYV